MPFSKNKDVNTSFLPNQIMVLGLGALLLPLMSTFMTTLLTSGTLSISGGRRRRRSVNSDPLNMSPKDQSSSSSLPITGSSTSEALLDLIMEEIESAIEKFASKYLNPTNPTQFSY